jgi:hypothetical protein
VIALLTTQDRDLGPEIHVGGTAKWLRRRVERKIRRVGTFMFRIGRLSEDIETLPSED